MPIAGQVSDMELIRRIEDYLAQCSEDSVWTQNIGGPEKEPSTARNPFFESNSHD
jgi:CRISPR/Cas system type I-B associated protein Csh2 (Cas7 group RAMP superfamily)